MAETAHEIHLRSGVWTDLDTIRAEHRQEAATRTQALAEMRRQVADRLAPLVVHRHPTRRQATQVEELKRMLAFIDQRREVRL